MSWYSSTSTYFQRRWYAASTPGWFSKSRAVKQDQVAEVERVRAAQLGLVALVELAQTLALERVVAREVGRELAAVLEPVEGRAHAARRPALLVGVERPQHALHQRQRVVLVVDREVRLVAELRDVAAQDAHAGGVEGRDPDPARAAAEDPLDPLAHLARGLVGERDREDLVRVGGAARDQVRDAVRQHARLAAARAREDEQRALDVANRLGLLGVQPRGDLVQTWHRATVARRKRRCYSTRRHSTVTDFARLRGWSTSVPFRVATW